MSQKVICDTNIISRYLEGKNEQILTTIDEKIGRENVYITPVIRMELLNWLSSFQSLDKSKRAKYKRFITHLPLIHLNEPISKIAVEISDKNINSKPSDILIGATAVYHKIKVFTIDADFEHMKIPLYENI